MGTEGTDGANGSASAALVALPLWRVTAAMCANNSTTEKAQKEHRWRQEENRPLLERAIAPLKAAEQSQALSLPDGTLTQQGRAVLASVAAGELAPGQGAALLGAIGTLARVAEIDELARRVEVLEEKNAKP